jgi:hypothetical protein
MAWREVRRRHKLIFRFDPDLDLIEIVIRGKRDVIQLNDYRLPNQRPVEQMCEVQTDHEGIPQS